MSDPGFKRFWTAYSVWGLQLNLDELLKDGQPVAFNEVWRQGDYNPLGGGALTAGLSMDVYSGSVELALHEAVAAFLAREARLLEAVRRQAPSVGHAGLSTVISVGSIEDGHVGLELPSSVMKLVAGAGLSWSIAASVFQGSASDESE